MGQLRMIVRGCVKADGYRQNLNFRRNINILQGAYFRRFSPILPLRNRQKCRPETGGENIGIFSRYNFSPNVPDGIFFVIRSPEHKPFGEKQNELLPDLETQNGRHYRPG